MRSNSLSLVALLACSCNQVYGLDDTTRRDAAFFDTPTDAPYACPPIGTPPTFSRVFEQAVLQSCTDYTVSVTGRAMASCNMVGTRLISEGPVDAPLVAARGFDLPQFQYASPRIGADGLRAIVRVYDGFTDRVRVFSRTGDTWVMGPEITAPQPVIATSGLTRDGHVFLQTAGGFREVADDGNGVYGEIGVTTLADLGVTSFAAPFVTADGLRLLFTQGKQLHYADRSGSPQKFSKAVPLPQLEFIPPGFMTEDCARLYFSALDNVFAAHPL